MDPHHVDRPPAAFVVRHAQLAPAGCTVLDVAAGGGRHARFFASRGHRVVAVDRDVEALRALADPRIEVVEADLEANGWPFAGRTFGLVVVIDYLWRPLLPAIVAAVAPGGALLYETFAVGNERYGRPRNPDFLLREGELLAAVRGELRVVEHTHGERGDPPTCVRQSLVALR